jgi:hypothetical protein
MIQHLRDNQTTFSWQSGLRGVNGESPYPAYLEMKNGGTKSRLSAHIMSKKASEFAIIRPQSVGLKR